MIVLDMMTAEQRAKAGKSMAMSRMTVPHHQIGVHPIRSTGHFHMVMGMETPEKPITPSVSLRIQRARFILEEFLELLAGMGLELHLDGSRIPTDHDSFTIEHIEGSRYDVVETSDALSDLNVVVNGTGVEFGLPLHVTDHEVYCSNLTKLDSEGKPIRNGITEGYRKAGQADEYTVLAEDEPGYRPDLPVGKILKPEGFIPANIPAALLAFENQEF